MYPIIILFLYIIISHFLIPPPLTIKSIHIPMPPQIQHLHMMSKHCRCSLCYRITLKVIKHIFNKRIKEQQLNKTKQRQQSLPLRLNKLPIIPIQKYRFQQTPCYQRDNMHI